MRIEDVFFRLVNDPRIGRGHQVCFMSELNLLENASFKHIEEASMMEFLERANNKFRARNARVLLDIETQVARRSNDETALKSFRHLLPRYIESFGLESRTLEFENNIKKKIKLLKSRGKLTRSVKDDIIAVGRIWKNRPMRVEDVVLQQMAAAQM